MKKMKKFSIFLFTKKLIKRSRKYDQIARERGLAHRGWHAASFGNGFCSKSSGSRVCKVPTGPPGITGLSILERIYSMFNS